MLKKNLPATATLAALLLFAALLLPDSASAISGPPPPDVYMAVTPKALPVSTGCSATFNVQLVSQEGYQGLMNLVTMSTPNGVNATFYPNPVSVREYGEANSKLTVTVSPDTPQGVTSLSLKATSADRRISHTATVTLNIGPPCTQPQNENITTTTTISSSNSIITVISIVTLTQTITTIQTSTSTTTLLTAFTSTTTVSSLEQSVESLTSVWAIGATIATFALAEVLLLKKIK